MRRWIVVGSTLLLIGALVMSLTMSVFDDAVAAEASADTINAVNRTWERTDKPINDGAIHRTWMWGPQANTDYLFEPYAEAPGGQRAVIYYDKSRMEDATYRNVAPWDITNGLLVVELVTGEMQLGDNKFESHEPAQINAAGDLDGTTGPTYQTLGGVLDVVPLGQDSVIRQRIDRVGTVTDDANMANYGVTAAHLDPETNHMVASVFWNFMNASGLVYEDGQLITDKLFLNPYYATGRPITEAYWTTVEVAETPQDVLVQAFERRVLTYTPGNEEGWQVEAGNVGQHYYQWRYGTDDGGEDDGDATATGTPSPSETEPPTETGEATETEAPDDGVPATATEAIHTYDLSALLDFTAGLFVGQATAGGYEIIVPDDDDWLIWVDEQNYSDASFEIDTRITNASTGGLACLDLRVNVSVDAVESDYRLCLKYTAEESGGDPVGNSVVLQNRKGSSPTQLGSWDLSPSVDAGSWNNLRVVAQGNSFWIYFNDTYLGKVDDTDQLSGRAGFSLIDDFGDGGGATSSAEFRDLVVYPLE